MNLVVLNFYMLSVSPGPFEKCVALGNPETGFTFDFRNLSYSAPGTMSASLN